MNISLQGYDNKYATFGVEEAAQVGSVVTVSDNNTVATAAEGVFSGVLTTKERGMALVQLGGYVKLPYENPQEAGQELKLGYNKVGAKQGKLTANPNGRGVIVVELDAQAATAGIIL